VTGILDATQPRPPRDRVCRRTTAARAISKLQQGKGDTARWPALEEGTPVRSAMLTTIGEITHRLRAWAISDFRYANEPWRPGHPKPRGLVRQGREAAAALPKPCRVG